MFYVTDEKYNEGIESNYYRDGWELISAYLTKGESKQKWCYPQGKDGPREKAVPWKIKLGERETALNILRSIMKEIQGDTISDNEDNITDEEIPF